MRLVLLLGFFTIAAAANADEVLLKLLKRLMVKEEETAGISSALETKRQANKGSYDVSLPGGIQLTGSHEAGEGAPANCPQNIDVERLDELEEKMMNRLDKLDSRFDEILSKISSCQALSENGGVSNSGAANSGTNSGSSSGATNNGDTWTNHEQRSSEEYEDCALCNPSAEGNQPPGSITMLRRQDGSVNFTRPWADYQSGFGDVDGELWLGLDNLHKITWRKCFSLNVTMMAFDRQILWAYYSLFEVGPERDNYPLVVHGFDSKSTANNALSYHTGMRFSTYDKDNDKYYSSCSAKHKGGWWYNSCAYANPTGLYLYDPSSQGIIFSNRRFPSYYSFKEMVFTLIPPPADECKRK